MGSERNGGYRIDDGDLRARVSKAEDSIEALETGGGAILRALAEVQKTQDATLAIVRDIALRQGEQADKVDAVIDGERDLRERFRRYKTETEGKLARVKRDAEASGSAAAVSAVQASGLVRDSVSEIVDHKLDRRELDHAKKELDEAKGWKRFLGEKAIEKGIALFASFTLLLLMIIGYLAIHGLPWAMR